MQQDRNAEKNRGLFKTLQDTALYQKDLREALSTNNHMLVNVHGIEGMGKHRLLEDVSQTLTALGIKNSGIINVSHDGNLLNLTRQVSKWINDEVLATGNRPSSTVDDLERDFHYFRTKLKERGNLASPFAILIKNFDNLPFDDLDWFQMHVIDAFKDIPGSIVIVASQNELSWHTWEARQNCLDVKLPVLSEQQIFERTKSEVLAKTVRALSGGHPKTATALIEYVKRHGKPLTMVTKEDLKGLEKGLFEVLRKEINANLSYKTNQRWLKEAFYLTAAIDGFDADLISDVVSKFKIKIPNNVTDCAWEMAYTGLVAWDFDAKTYKMVPELRDRILVFMQQERKKDFVKVLNTVGDSYLLRAQILPDPRAQILKAVKYFKKARKLDGKTDDSQSELLQKLRKAFQGDRELTKIVNELHKKGSLKIR